MARKITEDAIHAFIYAINFNRDNTRVIVEDHQTGVLVRLTLHGHTIAQRVNGVLKVTNAGWFTTTTKERLNGLPGVSIKQVKGVWYLNGKEWDGSWTTI